MELDQPAGQDNEQSRAAVPGLRLEGLDHLAPQYANLIHVAFDAYAFQLTFARIAVPAVWTNDEMDAALRQGIPATAVGQIIVAPNALRDFIDVLQARLDNFEETYGPIRSVDGGTLGTAEANDGDHP